MAGIGNLFAGLLDGIGETTQKLSKEKKDREEREKMQQLDLFKTILMHPQIDTETKNKAFRGALEISTGGNKKMAEQVHSILGPALAGDGDQSDSLGGSPQSGTTSTLPSSSLPRMGPAPHRGAFMTPEEMTQQKVSEQRQLGEVQVEQNVRQASQIGDVQNKKALELAEKLTPIEVDRAVKLAAASGFTETVGFDHAEDGTPILVTRNPASGATRRDPMGKGFQTKEGFSATEQFAAKNTAEAEDSTNTILRSQGIDPKVATPEQKAAASKTAAQMQVDATQSGTTLRNSEAFANMVRAHLAAEGKDTKSLSDNQLILFYGAQEKAYDRKSTEIQNLVGEVNDLTTKAQEYVAAAQSIEEGLKQRGLGRDKDANINTPEYQARAAARQTWAERDRLYDQARALATQAKEKAKFARVHFGQDVEVTGDEGPAEKSFPTVKDVRQPFQFQMPTSLPEMPSSKKKGAAGRGSSTITVDPSKFPGLKF